MRTLTVILMAVSISFCFFIVPSYGADVAKIGVVDFQRIFGTSIAGKQAKAEIQKQGKQMEADLKNKYAEIEEIKKKLEREALVMSKEMRGEKERDLRIRINDFKSLQKRYENSMRDVEKKFVTRIRKELFEIVQKIGKNEGYLLIIERVGVLYSPKTVDITDIIIQKYNASFAEKAEDKSKVKKAE
ncbi:MAG: OmpH family outer membrane protein [Desulfobacterales bacterium]|nr:MAG: OmpH family outer membrane protein [Desulfobacterales bacterium]UCD89045.1 MAG: OmpH family outer membrane protein [Desulfobacterales bacterium]